MIGLEGDVARQVEVRQQGPEHGEAADPRMDQHRVLADPA
jgi:hypothetical protein